MSDKQILFYYYDNIGNGQSFYTQVANFGYQTTIRMSLDLQLDGNGLPYYNDNGEAYDKRTCNFTTLLDAENQAILIDAYQDNAKGRARNWFMSVPSTNSGFFPFAPDKGFSNRFTVSLDIKDSAALPSPYKYFRNNFIATNVAAWPLYNKPTDVSEGNIIIGSTSGIRYPKGWFDYNRTLSNDLLITEGNASYWRDVPSLSDQQTTSFTLRCSAIKAAWLIYDITHTLRGNTFSFTSTAGSHPFGKNNSSAGPFDVKLSSPEIMVTHQDYDWIEIPLSFTLIEDNG